MTPAAALAAIRANVESNTDPSIVPQSAIDSPLANAFNAPTAHGITPRDPLSPPSHALPLLP